VDSQRLFLLLWLFYFFSGFVFFGVSGFDFLGVSGFAFFVASVFAIVLLLRARRVTSSFFGGSLDFVVDARRSLRRNDVSFAGLVVLLDLLLFLVFFLEMDDFFVFLVFFGFASVFFVTEFFLDATEFFLDLTEFFLDITEFFLDATEFFLDMTEFFLESLRVLFPTVVNLNRCTVSPISKTFFFNTILQSFFQMRIEGSTIT